MIDRPTLFDTADPPIVVEPSIPANLPIGERYAAWIALNEWVLDAFERLADEAVAEGATRIGGQHLVEILRWRYRATTRGDTFKLNNSFTPRLVRDLVDRRPDLEGLFETRRLRT